MAREGAVPRGDRKSSVGSRPTLSSVGGEQGAEDPLDLNRLIHERVRLGIVSALAVNESLSFSDLKAFLKTTDGNLSAHARKLEEAGYIECRKSFVERVPRTEYRLTKLGRREFGRYLDHMESLIRAAREG